MFNYPVSETPVFSAMILSFIPSQQQSTTQPLTPSSGEKGGRSEKSKTHWLW